MEKQSMKGYALFSGCTVPGAALFGSSTLRSRGNIRTRRTVSSEPLLVDPEIEKTAHNGTASPPPRSPRIHAKQRPIPRRPQTPPPAPQSDPYQMMDMRLALIESKLEAVNRIGQAHAEMMRHVYAASHPGFMTSDQYSAFVAWPGDQSFPAGGGRPQAGTAAMDEDDDDDESLLGELGAVGTALLHPWVLLLLPFPPLLARVVSQGEDVVVRVDAQWRIKCRIHIQLVLRLAMAGGMETPISFFVVCHPFVSVERKQWSEQLERLRTKENNFGGALSTRTSMKTVVVISSNGDVIMVMKDAIRI
ncbi:hypothetical protein LR48_Vigan06g013400 [Vigna angularis]|uniref:Uncharacterized protein n=1 Tax=Phaseolus angularis TaxID=3914 RepID=A0A0L9UQ06_PHAAN|nr:hypothetical protein LR48_Vigan06g013400 [Vigna angularis]